jgi:hypothetical protein
MAMERGLCGVKPDTFSGSPERVERLLAGPCPLPTDTLINIKGVEAGYVGLLPVRELSFVSKQSKPKGDRHEESNGRN